MLAINAAPGRELVDPPWPRLRPALGLLVALGVIGYYGSKIGDDVRPEVVIDTGAEAVPGPEAELVLSSATPRDFQVVVRTGVCTTVQFAWVGAGSEGEDVIDRCVSSHILSPPAGVRLVPDSDYFVTATFTGEDGTQSSFEYRLATAAS